MDKREEALKLALEALVRADRISGYPNNKEAIIAIREALAQPNYRAMYLKVRDELAELQQRSER